MRILSLVLVLAVPVAVGQEIYKWTDEDGRVHYGDRAVPEVTTEALTVRSAPGPDATLERRRERQRRVLDALAEEREEREDGRERAARQAQERVQNCERAQNRVRGLERAGRVYKVDEGGQRHYLSDEARANAIDEAKRLVARWCG